MKSRNYYKLFSTDNREQGSEKLLLGYIADQTQILLKKDSNTWFHIPFQASSILLSASGLEDCGAIGGPFPAAADRIFQSQKNYSNQTNNGKLLSAENTGTWFCSWLYENPEGSLQWYDRYYNPDGFVKNSDLLFATLSSMFVDIPSRMTLDPGVLYQYYHVGENTANALLDTLQDQISSNIVAFNLSKWGEAEVDTASNNNPVTVQSEAPLNVLYPNLIEPQRVNGKFLSFDHEYNVNCLMPYKQEICPTENFTLSFWTRNDKWELCPSTQLVGNFSSNGGFGVFVEALSSFPIFVVPETHYGHIFIVNEKGSGVADKVATKGFGLSACPRFVGIDSNGHIVYCHDDNTGSVYKIDHLGNPLASTKSTANLFSFDSNTEKPLRLLIGQHDDVYVITNAKIYIFDTNLKLKVKTTNATSSNSSFAFKSNQLGTAADLIIDNQSIDLKFQDQTKWSINKPDFHLYKNDEIFYKFGDATAFNIDPYDRIWVLHGTNKITILNTNYATEEEKVVTQIRFGADEAREQTYISFLQTYERKTQTFEWVAMIRYSNDRVVYLLDMEGELYKTFNINNFYKKRIANDLNQLSRYFKFISRGDYTGYDHRRVFSKIAPFYKKRQLILKASLRDYQQSVGNFYIFSCQIPIDTWDNENWQHVAVTYKNRKFKLFVNGKLVNSFVHRENYQLSYETQPTWHIGTPVGNKNGFNNEIINESCIFNGYFETIKLLNRALNDDEIPLLIKASLIGDDINWSVNTPSLPYVEKIERVFKHKLPGAKSALYKIKISGMEVSDPLIKSLIEKEIIETATQIEPSYTNLISVEWT